MNEFEKLLQENLVPLKRFVNFKINNKYDAEDIIQDICLTALLKFETINNTSAFKAWLISIAKHKINDYYRKKATKLEIPLEYIYESTFGASRFGITEQITVNDTLASLKDKEKQILYLYYLKNCFF